MNGLRLLWVSDSPALATGCGTTAKQVLSRLASAGYRICCLGFGHAMARSSLGTFPCDVFDWEPGSIGRLQHVARRFRPEVLLSLGPPTTFAAILTALESMDCPWVAYPVIGASPLPSECADVLRCADLLLAATHFGEHVLTAALPYAEPRVIPIGVDGAVFRPLDDRQERRLAYNLGDKFVVGFSGRNAVMNQIPRLLRAFARFAEKRPEAFLYLHTDPEEPWGWDLAELIRRCGVYDKCGLTPNFAVSKGVNESELNEIYNLFDVLALPTSGAALGLPMLEAMAAGIPVVATDCAANQAAAYGCARLVRVATHFTDVREGLDLPLADEDDLAASLLELSASPAARDELAQRGLARAAELTWDRCAARLDEAIREVVGAGPSYGDGLGAFRSAARREAPGPPKRAIPAYKQRHTVAFVAPQLWLGGGEVHLKEVVNHLHERDQFNLAVASLNEYGDRWQRLFQETGVNLADELCVDAVYQLPHNLPVPQKRARLARWIQDLDPDVLVFYGFDWAVQAIRTLPQRPPAVVEVCHLTPPPAYKPSNMDVTDRLVCVSEQIARQILRASPELEERIVVIPNGVREYRPTLRNAREDFGFSSGHFVAGFVGRFDDNKRPEDLIRAISVIDDPQVKALLLGWGPLQPRCRQLIADLGLEQRVIISPPRRDLGNVYAAMDCLCLLSETEGAPLAVLEAALAAVPIVTTPVGNVCDVFSDGASGLFVQVGDIVGLADAIVRLARSPDLRAALSRNGRDAVLSGGLTAERMAEKYAELFSSLIDHETQPAEEVLLYRDVGLGDVLMATSGARALKQRAWETRITFAARRPYHELLAANPYVDRVLPDDQLPESGPETHVYLRHASAWYRQRHIIDVHLEQLGQPPSSINRTVDLFLTRSDRREAQALIGKDTEPAQAIVAIHPYGTVPAKHWAEDRWAEVVRYLRQKGFRVVQVGSPDEPLIEGAEPVRLAGPDSLRVAAAVVERCSFLVCIDSGFQQVAQGVSTPAIVLYGGASGGIAPSAYPENLNLESSLECKCNLSQGHLALCGWEPCSRDFECMRHLSVHQVLGAVEAMIEELGLGRGERVEVSVVMVNRNGGAQLRPTVEAVLSQAGVDLELIVVDDGSSDGSLAHLAACRDQRLRVVPQREKGEALAAAAGLKRARGEFVLLLDPDQALLPDALSAMVASLEGHPDRAMVIGGSGEGICLWRRVAHQAIGYPPNVPLPRYFLRLALTHEFGEPFRLEAPVAVPACDPLAGEDAWEPGIAAALTRRAWHLWKIVSADEPQAPRAAEAVAARCGTPRNSSSASPGGSWHLLQEVADTYLGISCEGCLTLALDLHGHTVVLETNRSWLADFLRARLDSFVLRGLPEAAEVALRVLLVPDAGWLPQGISPREIARGKFLSERERSVLVFAPTQHSVFVADMRARQLTTMLVEPYTDAFWLATSISELIPQLLLGDSLTRLHASAVARDGRAVLFAGSTGAGKSTLALAMAREGFQLISDDKPLLVRSGQGVTVLPYCQDIHLRADARAFLPELEALALTHEPGFDATGRLAADVMPGARKICFPAREVFPDACQSPAEAALLLFVEIHPDEGWRLEPITEEQVRGRLSQEKLRFDGDDWPPVLECYQATTNRLIRTTRQFVLRAGRDLSGLADHLSGLLDEARART